MSDFKLPPYKAIPVPGIRPYSAEDTADWGHAYMQPQSFWNEGYTGTGTVVFVIDTGVYADHPDLDGRVIHRKDFTGEDTDVLDPNGHGTWCASRIASPVNGFGVVGIAPGAVIVDLRVLNSGGSGSNSWVAEAYRYAADVILPPPYQHWRRVTSASLGSSRPSALVEDAVKYAVSLGVINVAAAGNDGNGSDKNTINYPARYAEQVLAVGAIQENQQVAPYSSAGDELDSVAPGSMLLGAYQGGYAYLTGTSMATPGVAGAVALLLEKYGRELRNQQEVEYYLRLHATDLAAPGWDILSGSGAIRLEKYAANAPADTPPEEEPTDPEPPADVPSGCLPAWLRKFFNLNYKRDNTMDTKQEVVGQYGYTEIVDTLKDGVKLEMDIRSKLAGKFDIIKAIQSGLAAYPTVKEAIEDWPVFSQEIGDIFPAESKAVLADIERQLTDEEKQKSRLLRVIRLAVQGHVDITETIAKGIHLKDLGAHIFAAE